MKTYYYRLFSLLIIIFLIGCQEKYELNIDFDAPQSLVAPSNNQLINIDLTEGTPSMFEWDKSTSRSGGVVLYEVYFDKANGDFSNPIFKILSNQGGGDNWLSLTPKQLLRIAKSAGIAINSEGSIKWKVIASQGGERKDVQETRTLRLYRPEGMEIPAQLFVFGSGFEVNALSNAFKCREMEEGVYEIFGSATNGEIKLCNGTDGTITYYKWDVNNNKLIETEDGSGTNVTGTGNAYRITVDFNTLKVNMTEIKEIKMVRTWEYNLGSFQYIGNHQFSAKNIPVTFYHDWGFPEERYRFWVTTNSGQERWGSYLDDSMFGTNVPGMAPYSIRPDGGQPKEYYNIYNLADLPSQGQNQDWTGMYKLPTASENKNINVLIDMSPKNGYTHTITISE